MKAVILAVLLACFLSSCYHFGAPGSDSFVLAEIHVDNNTKEPTLNRHIVTALREHVSTEPSAAKGKSVYDVQVKLGELRNYSIARAKVRDKRSVDRDSDAYQTVYHRIAITADVIVTPKGGGQPVLSKPYIGYGDIPRMHDRELPLQAACRQAANSLATQFIDDLATLAE